LQKNRLSSQGIDPRSYKVSVFTPAYNSGDLLRRAYASLKAQTWRNWEWIIYNDSTDNITREVINDLILGDRRIKGFKGEAHSGVIGFTKLECCKQASGRLLAELDHDDVINQDCLETVVKAFKAYPDAVFAYTDCCEPYEGRGGIFNDFGDGWGKGMGAHYYQYFDGGYICIHESPPIRPASLSHIVGVPNHLRVWDRETYWKVGGHDPSLPEVDDYDLILRTFSAGRFIKIPFLHYFQFIRPDNKNTTDQRREKIQDVVPRIYSKYKSRVDATFTEYGIDPSIDTRNYWEHADYIPVANYTYNPNDGLISVILPTYNRPDALRKAIDSVLEQTYKNFELIIVGDSDDNLPETLSSYSDSRIKWWNLSENHGAGGAVPRNYALKMLAIGNYIAYIDDDMLWKREHLSTLYGSIQDSGADYAISSMYLGDPINKSMLCREPKLFRIDTSSIMHKKELLHKHGYWINREEGGYSHDWELVSRWKDHPWAATLKDTLIYNMDSPFNDMVGIYNYYGDQNETL
jgi:glycosyltransferase involved in cell wall biosynthesis